MSNMSDYYSDSVANHHKSYRLRVDKTIVGFMQERDNQNLFYSKDNLWWTNEKIAHNYRDRATGYLDANRNMIYEYDVILVKKTATTQYTQRGWVVWNIHNNHPELHLLEEDKSIPFPRKKTAVAPFMDHYKVLNQLFVNVT